MSTYTIKTTLISFLMVLGFLLSSAHSVAQVMNAPVDETANEQSLDAIALAAASNTVKSFFFIADHA